MFVESSPWRLRARKVIQQVAAANPNASEKQLRKLFREAYPFHERKYHPYKLWLDEVKRHFKPPPPRKPFQPLPPPDIEGQEFMF